MTQVVSEDNELKKLLTSPAKNAGEDGSMAPPSSVRYTAHLAFHIYMYIFFQYYLYIKYSLCTDERAEAEYVAKCYPTVNDKSDDAD